MRVRASERKEESRKKERKEDYNIIGKEGGVRGHSTVFIAGFHWTFYFPFR